MVRSVMAAMIVFFVAILGSSCSTFTGSLSSVIVDHRYDSEFPTRPVSSYLQHIAESVLRLNSIAYYQTYAFGAAERFRPAEITDAVLNAHQGSSVLSSSSTSGTATVISRTSREIALLTCAHVVSFPETVFTFQYSPEKRQTEFVASVSILRNVVLYVATLPEGGKVDLIVADRENDLAVVGRKFEESESFVSPVVPCPFGRASELEWGTFLYLFGYPGGNKVVTKGIVSSPEKDRQESFLVDAVFGRGFSGGICVALRDGPPNFELVGLIKMVPARSYYVLTPGKDRLPEDLEIGVPYGGESFVEKHTDIEYGWTQAISVESVKAFLLENQQRLKDEGFPVDHALGLEE